MKDHDHHENLWSDFIMNSSKNMLPIDYITVYPDVCNTILAMYLNCHSFFSFKYGAMSLTSLLAEAQSKGVSCMALTDINNTSGILDFFRLAPRHGVRAVAGIDFRNGMEQQFVGLA